MMGVLFAVFLAFYTMQLSGTEPAGNEHEAGFVSLFDGKTFGRWLNPTSRWSIQDGRMMFSGEVKSGRLEREDHKLMSVKEYEDFILRFEITW